MTEIRVGEQNDGPFRDPELNNADALTAMLDVTQEMTRVALHCRLRLLDLGFSDSHTLCKELDTTAAKYATSQELIRRHMRWMANDPL